MKSKNIHQQINNFKPRCKKELDEVIENLKNLVSSSQANSKIVQYGKKSPLKPRNK